MRTVEREEDGWFGGKIVREMGEENEWHGK
jgi:hypothetical protein